MSNYGLRRLQRGYMAVQSDPLTLPTLTGSNYCLFTKLTLDPVINSIIRPDITGNRNQLAGVRGRMSGSWAWDLTMAGNGSAGVAPSCDALLQASFGVAPTVVASTSVTYNLSDNLLSFALGRYRRSANGTALSDHIGMGCIPTTTTFTMGQDLATISSSGECIFILDGDNWGNFSTGMRGGYSSFPVEPSSPTQTSIATIGFVGSLSMDSGSIVDLKSATIKINTGGAIVKNTFGTYIGSGVEGDVRTITISLSVDDSDAAALTDLKQKAFLYTPINITLAVGNTTGNTWTFQLNQVQLTNVKYNDSQRRITFDIGDSGAHGSLATGLDALTLATAVLNRT